MRATRFRHPTEPFVAPPPNYPFVHPTFIFSQVSLSWGGRCWRPICADHPPSRLPCFSTQGQGICDKPLSITREKLSNRSEVIVAPASCRSTAEAGETPILLMLGVGKNFFCHHDRMLTYHGDSPFSVHQQTNRNPGLVLLFMGAR
jgi:hypothetical protein